MTFLQPTENPRLNEPVGFLLLVAGVALALSFVSYYPFDPSLNAAAGAAAPRNLIGVPGSYVSDLALQWLGLPAFLVPIFIVALAWRWVRSTAVPMLWARLLGTISLLMVSCAALAISGLPRFWFDTVAAGGVWGSVLADFLVAYLNPAGAGLTLAAAGIASLYLATSFSLESSLRCWHTAQRWCQPWIEQSKDWLFGLRERVLRRQAAKAQSKPRARKILPAIPGAAATGDVSPQRPTQDDGSPALPPIVPYDGAQLVGAAAERRLPANAETLGEASKADEAADAPPWDESPPIGKMSAPSYFIPSTLLLQPPSAPSTYDPEELQQVARQICAKFDEFNVRGTVNQINPGPVVTTFEFKLDPGIKYSKIVQLTEDLCLALECESILVERIPGKSTIGIEAPNRNREIISLREIVESSAFQNSKSLLTMALGKDINGKIHVADLASMPHLLVAGSTGSGKSVLINSIIMSVLYKATPEQVRFIMVDPKTVELGLYHDIPHLLTPVITDMKKASNALKNVSREMERRLKLLAEHGVRNLDQFNRKVEKLAKRPSALRPADAEPLEKLPYIVVIIDELSDLMMVEGRQIEESITRLAQMSRAAGIHLILATQRPSVDVITGLIKANIPARLSFRLATRVDSRTILDQMGAESLLGCGDMLFLPPGSGRMTRLHGPFVAEDEIGAVCKAWKDQAEPRYETGYLAAPAGKKEDGGGDDEKGFDDPVYEEALRIVLEMGKASTSTLQRRLRLGYGRAARILDAMERDGIIGPPDGSRPREVLKRPDWLAEVERR